jgi:DNA-binding transcriptional regulator LsrR (DeoR family)
MVMNDMDTNNRDLLVDVSVMYYLEGKTQTEISKELYMSRPKVSRLLKKARDLNIVDIKINYESDDFNRVATQIKKRFGVENVVIVKTLSNEEDTIKQIGKAASNELKYYLQDGSKIGMSWGRTVKSMVDAFKPKNFRDIKIVELFGAVEYAENREEFLSIGYNFSQKVHGTYYALPSPLYINDYQTRQILLENQIIKNTLKMIEDCDLIVTSIGVVDSDLPQRIWDAHVDPKTRKELMDKGAKGYLCAHFFDQDGKFIEHALNDNIIGIKTNTIRSKSIMLLAGWMTKAEAICSVLKGGYIKTLISDDKTLKQILEIDKSARGEYL